MCGPTASNAVDVCVVWWWPPAQGMSRKDEYRIYAEMRQLHTNRRREPSSSVIPRLQPCERGTAKEKSTTNSQGTSKFTSPQQSYAAALRQDKQHQQPQTTHTEQQYLLQKEFQKTGLSVQALSSSNNDSVATVVHQIMTKVTKALSEEERVMVIKNWYLT
jgi:glutamate synthase domain-containing protein 2